MIASLTGKVQSVADESLVLDVQGVGFEVFLTKTHLASCRVGEPLYLLIHTIVREELIALYGFESAEDKQYFLYLLGADGVGPRLALAVLSTLSLDAIKRAVLSEQPEVFARVPGIGKKTSQKILIQLQGKVAADFEPGLHKRASQADDEVIEALISLGYSVVEAQSAIQALPPETPDTLEDKLRLCLQYFDH